MFKKLLTKKTIVTYRLDVQTFEQTVIYNINLSNKILIEADKIFSLINSFYFISFLLFAILQI